METLIGKTLGRYRLESSLGTGGMAEVFGEDGGLPFLVMPLVEGGALSARLEGSPLPPGQVRMSPARVRERASRPRAFRGDTR